MVSVNPAYDSINAYYNREKTKNHVKGAVASAATVGAVGVAANKFLKSPKAQSVVFGNITKYADKVANWGIMKFLTTPAKVEGSVWKFPKFVDKLRAASTFTLTGIASAIAKNPKTAFFTVAGALLAGALHKISNNTAYKDGQIDKEKEIAQNMYA